MNSVTLWLVRIHLRGDLEVEVWLPGPKKPSDYAIAEKVAKKLNATGIPRDSVEKVSLLRVEIPLEES